MLFLLYLAVSYLSLALNVSLRALITNVRVALHENVQDANQLQKGPQGVFY